MSGYFGGRDALTLERGQCSVRGVKGFVLAAGFGQRLRPITETVPKPLLPVGNLPLIAYPLKLLAYHGIHEVIVNVHHLGKQLKEALGDGSQYGVEITYSEEDEILGTGGGLKKMHEALADDTFVVLNSDTVLDVDLHAVIDFHRRQRSLATMVLREDPEQEQYGQIEIDDHGRIQRILGQSAESTLDCTLRPLMFSGVHVLEPRFLDYIPPDVSTCVNRYAYVKALKNGEPLFGTVMDGYWADAGTPERYRQVNLDAMEQRVSLRHADPLSGFALEPTKDVASVVRMGEDVELGANVHIVPPVLLGDGVRVGDDSTVGPNTIVGAKANIGASSTIANSIVLAGTRIDASRTFEGELVGRKGSVPLRDDPAKETDSDEPEEPRVGP